MLQQQPFAAARLHDYLTNLLSDRYVCYILLLCRARLHNAMQQCLQPHVRIHSTAVCTTFVCAILSIMPVTMIMPKLLRQAVRLLCTHAYMCMARTFYTRCSGGPRRACLYPPCFWCLHAMCMRCVQLCHVYYMLDRGTGILGNCSSHEPPAALNSS
jgi:hypothetical protein